MASYFGKSKKVKRKKPRLTEESPDWTPGRDGNKRGGGAFYYKKSRSRTRPD